MGSSLSTISPDFYLFIFFLQFSNFYDSFFVFINIGKNATPPVFTQSEPNVMVYKVVMGVGDKICQTLKMSWHFDILT